MPPADLAAALEVHDMFLYCGHGCGEKYLGQRSLKRLSTCSAALLMGCSSGRLARRGLYDPCGPILAYLQAGETDVGLPRNFGLDSIDQDGQC
jgi:separase